MNKNSLLKCNTRGWRLALTVASTLTPLTMACGSPDREHAEDTGSINLALTAPGDAFCVEERVKNVVNGREVVVSRELVPATSQIIELPSVPAGDVELTAFVTDGFADGACVGNRTYEAEPQRLSLPPGRTANATQRFFARAGLVIDGDFETDIYESACAEQSPTSSWSEEFTAPSLDLAWTVWEYTGPRNNSQSSPANHFSLADSAGKLRYYVDPMTYPAARYDYAPYFASPYYWYDPGLSVERELGGVRWTLDVKAEYFVPNVVNAAQHEVAIRFDSPGTAGLHCYFDRYSNDDVGAGTSQTNNIFFAGCSIGDTSLGSGWSEWAGLETNIVRFVRFEREGENLSLRVSADETSWNEVLSVTLPEEFLCVPQRLLISGAAWFSPQGSYADYDYVRFSRQDP